MSNKPIHNNNANGSLNSLFDDNDSTIIQEASVEEILYNKLLQYGKSKKIIGNPTIIGDVVVQSTPTPAPSAALFDIKNKVYRHQPLEINDVINLSKSLNKIQ